jgi:hypothetical protein
MNIETVNLNVINEAVSRRITHLELNAANFEVTRLIDEVVGDMVLTLTHRRAVQHLRESVAKYPATWWQHVKERFFPEWLKRKFPVVYTHVLVDAQVFYDKIAVPQQTTEFKIAKVSFKEDI